MDKVDIEKICRGYPASEMSKAEYKKFQELALDEFARIVKNKHLYVYSTNYRISRAFGQRICGAFSILYEPKSNHIRPPSVIAIVSIRQPSHAQSSRLNELYRNVASMKVPPEIWHLEVWQ